jgi:outer membrane protein assembly factor BamD
LTSSPLAGVRKGLCVPFDLRANLRSGLTVALMLTVVACGHRKQKEPPQGSVDADKFLYTRGSELLAKKNWITAREYFKRIVDSYPQSTYRADAKLGVGDSYLGENHVDTLILAVNEYREFLQFFPLNNRADYAQFHLALAQSRQMLAAERDQTATHETLAEVQRFRDAYPKSEFMPEVDKIYQQARERLSESEFHVGLLYFRVHGYAGALARFVDLINADPNYSKRDQLYFYMAETCIKGSNLKPQAIEYYEKLITEYPKSKFAKRAQRRLAMIKQADAKAGK